jgi:hypothetical protein
LIFRESYGNIGIHKIKDFKEQFMFIPTTSIAKGRPVAFIPDTLDAGKTLDYLTYELTRDPFLAYVCAYWQEGVVSKRLACYGVVYVKLDAQRFPLGIDSPGFAFKDFLESADLDYVLSGSGAGFFASHKLGNTKPYSCNLEKWYPKYDSAYNPNELAKLLVFPEDVPNNAIAWHKLIANTNPI